MTVTAVRPVAPARSLVLVDASPYIFRAFFALPSSMVSPRGEPVNAVYGFIGFLLRLLNEERPTHLAVAFDGSLTTSFRNAIYPEYKAHRELPPPELEAQQDWCREAAAALGAATFVDSSFEADDLIATLAARVVEEPFATVQVVTGDKDLAQLVDHRTSLYDFARGDRLSAAGVRGKLGVPPERVVDLLALAGDPVDNIPGVRGIGRKTACALIEHFGPLEDLYERLEELPELGIRGAASVRKKLEEQRDRAFLSRQLATVSREAPVELAEIASLAWSGPQPGELTELCARLGFDALEQRVTRELGAALDQRFRSEAPNGESSVGSETSSQRGLFDDSGSCEPNE